jgi:hypothetical protein
VRKEYVSYSPQEAQKAQCEDNSFKTNTASMKKINLFLNACTISIVLTSHKVFTLNLWRSLSNFSYVSCVNYGTYTRHLLPLDNRTFSTFCSFFFVESIAIYALHFGVSNRHREWYTLQCHKMTAFVPISLLFRGACTVWRRRWFGSNCRNIRWFKSSSLGKKSRFQKRTHW